MKKFLALVLALAMLLAVTTAFAATIAVQEVLDGETYTAYKILNSTSNGTAVSYYLTAAEYAEIGATLEDAGFEFEASADGTQYYVKNAETIDVAAAAEYLGSHVSDLGDALGKFEQTGNDGEVDFTGLTTGYYFVTSTAGSLCALNSDEAIVTAVEKNTVPTVEKTEKTTGSDYEEGPVDAGIGDTVHYQIVVTDGTGTDKDITLTDTMSAGLDYTAGSLQINGTAVADNADTNDWKVTVEGQKITIVLKGAYVATVDQDETITITYDATLNENAVVDSATGNENKVELEYSEQKDEDQVYVETYDFVVKKTDGSAFLDGSEFKLYDAATGGNQIKLSGNNADGYYVDTANGSADTTIDIDAAHGCNVRGLAPGDYYLEEVVIPNGYNALSDRTKVTITTGATSAVEVTVVNNAGTVLPSTGGIGTTIFYVVGGLLVIGAAVILVARRKVSE